MLHLTKVRRGLYEAFYRGHYIDFYKLPTDGLWRSSYFERDLPNDDKDFCRAFLSLKIAKMVCEMRLRSAA